MTREQDEKPGKTRIDGREMTIETQPERRFRNAWRLEGGVVDIGLAGAQAIARRELHEAALEARALAAGGMSALMAGLAMGAVPAPSPSLASAFAAGMAAIEAAQDTAALEAALDAALAAVRGRSSVR